jgi:hypothetical protein
MRTQLSRLRALLALTLIGLAVGISACAVKPVVTMLLRSSTPSDIAPAATGTATASCGKGEQLLGGGYTATASVAPAASYSASPNTWTVTLHNTLPATLTLTAFADCLQAPFSVAASSATSTPVNIAKDSEQEALATCPAGAYVTGGGYLTNPDLTGYIRASGPGAGLWDVDAVASGGALTLTTFAVCASANLYVPYPPPHSDMLVPLGGSNSTSLTCPKDQLLTSGGFADITLGPPVVSTNEPVSTSPSGLGKLDEWTFTARNANTSASPPSDQVRVYVVCAIPILPGTPTPVPPTAVPTATATLAPTPTNTPAPAAAKIKVSAPSSAFCLNNQYPPITVSNTGAHTLHWSGQPSDHAVTLNPASGTLVPGAAQMVQVSGSHGGATLEIAFTSDGGDVTLTFTCR